MSKRTRIPRTSSEHSTRFPEACATSVAQAFFRSQLFELQSDFYHARLPCSGRCKLWLFASPTD